MSLFTKSRRRRRVTTPPPPVAVGVLSRSLAGVENILRHATAADVCTAFADSTQLEWLLKLLPDGARATRVILGFASTNASTWKTAEYSTEKTPVEIDCRVPPPTHPRVHAKYIIAHGDDGQASVICGSANLTTAGFGANYEAMVVLTGDAESDPVRSFVQEFEQLFEKSLPAREFVQRVRCPKAADWADSEWTGPAIQDDESTSPPKALRSVRARPRVPVDDGELEVADDRRLDIEPTSPDVQLYPYQAEAVAKIQSSCRRALDSRGKWQRDLMVLPTGGGKTLTAVRALIPFLSGGHRILWVAHREELLEQAAQCFVQHGVSEGRIGYWNGVAKQAGRDKAVVMASVLATSDTRALFLHGGFDLVVVDEAHRSVTPSCRTLLEGLERRRSRYLLLMTATPERADEAGLFAGDDYDDVVADKCFVDLVESGHLVAPKYRWLHWSGKEEGGLSYSYKNGDFDFETLRQLAASDRRNDLIVENAVSGRAKTLLFAIGQEHARTLQARIRRRTSWCNVVLGDTERHQRREIISSFRNAPRGAVLINCAVFTEGFDVPDVTRIVLTRPTFSGTRYLQMVGRGARRANGKNRFEVLEVLDHFVADSRLESVARPWRLLPRSPPKFRSSFPFLEERQYLDKELQRSIAG